MNNADWFTRAFGHPVADVRKALISDSWFGGRDSPAEHSREQDSRQAPDAERDPLGRTRDPERQSQHDAVHKPEREAERGLERDPGHAFDIDR